jgi:hypothetical protein
LPRGTGMADIEQRGPMRPGDPL